MHHTVRQASKHQQERERLEKEESDRRLKEERKMEALAEDHRQKIRQLKLDTELRYIIIILRNILYPCVRRLGALYICIEIDSVMRA